MSIILIAHEFAHLYTGRPAPQNYQMARIPQRGNAKRSPTSEIEEFKKFLGPTAAHYSEHELHHLRREMSAVAEILLDFYLEKKRRAVTRPSEGSFDREPSDKYDKDNPSV